MQKSKKDSNIFDQFAILHELDQESFERERKRIIEEEIAKYPPKVQDRLRRFQWTLDMKRRKCKNALEACFMFHDMLMKQVYGENGLLENLQKLLAASKHLKDAKAPLSTKGYSSIEKENNINPHKITTKIFELKNFSKRAHENLVKEKVSGR